MENLHLKNIIQKPHPLIILQKLNDPDYCKSKYIPKELIKDIDVYINSLTFKNKEIKKEPIKITKYVYEYEKTSSATSLKVRKADNKRSASGNSLTIKRI